MAACSAVSCSKWTPPSSSTRGIWAHDQRRRCSPRRWPTRQWPTDRWCCAAGSNSSPRHRRLRLARRAMIRRRHVESSGVLPGFSRGHERVEHVTSYDERRISGRVRLDESGASSGYPVIWAAWDPASCPLPSGIYWARGCDGALRCLPPSPWKPAGRRHGRHQSGPSHAGCSQLCSCS